jgi:uncharacterized protein YoxC
VADNEAKLDFTADDKVARAAIDRLTKQVAGLEEQLRKLHETSKKGAEDSTKAISKQADEVERMIKGVDGWAKEVAEMIKGVNDLNPKLRKQAEHHSEIQHFLSEHTRELLKVGAGVLGVSTGVEGAISIYEQWKEKVKEIGKEHEALSKRIVKTLHESGLVKFGPEMEKFIESGAGGLGSQEQARQAVAGVTAGAPNASKEEVKAISAQVVKAAPLGVDLSERGTLMGRLHDIDKGKSADDLADIATVMTQKAGNRAGQLTDPAFLKTLRALKSGGMSIESAGGLALSALQNDQQMKKFGGLGELLERDAGDFAPKGNPHRLTPEEIEDQAFGKMDQAGRLKYLKTNERFALRHQAFAFNKLPAGQADMLANEIQAGESGNAFQGDLASLGQLHSGAVAIASQEAEIAKSKQEAALGPAANALTQFQNIRAAKSRNALTAGFRGLQFGIEDVGYALSGDKAGYVEREIKSSEAFGMITKDEAAKLIATLRENTEEMKRNTAAMRPNQAVNVNGHTEGGH